MSGQSIPILLKVHLVIIQKTVPLIRMQVHATRVASGDTLTPAFLSFPAKDTVLLLPLMPWQMQMRNWNWSRRLDGVSPPGWRLRNVCS